MKKIKYKLSILFAVSLLSMGCTSMLSGHKNFNETYYRTGVRTYPMYDIPEYYSSPEDLWKKVEFTLKKTSELIQRYDEGIRYPNLFNEVAYLNKRDENNPDEAAFEFKTDDKRIMYFLADIAGINISYSGGYASTDQFQSLNGVREVLTYYGKHKVDINYLYAYWYLYPIDRIVVSAMFLGDPEGATIALMEEKIIEKWPNSRAAALMKIEKFTDSITDVLNGILNRTPLPDSITH